VALRFDHRLSRLAYLLVAAVLLCVGPVAAQQWTPLSPVPIDPANRFEVRFGAFAHGVGSVERDTVDFNGSFVTPRLPIATNDFWAFIVPRFEIGGAANVSGRTSFGYVNALWTIPVWDRVFVEAYVGPAIHDGSLTATPTMAGLGCDVLFHAGANVGYRFNEHWSIMATFEHLSNGKTAFGIDCGTNRAATGSNQGLNNYGVRIGYAF
jgi:opacity protein-like surface antigen